MREGFRKLTLFIMGYKIPCNMGERFERARTGLFVPAIHYIGEMPDGIEYSPRRYFEGQQQGLRGLMEVSHLDAIFGIPALRKSLGELPYGEKIKITESDGSFSGVKRDDVLIEEMILFAQGTETGLIDYRSEEVGRCKEVTAKGTKNGVVVHLGATYLLPSTVPTHVYANIAAA
jgi:hypothetical protein